jgi:hypothetical protein
VEKIRIRRAVETADVTFLEMSCFCNALYISPCLIVFAATAQSYFLIGLPRSVSERSRLSDLQNLNRGDIRINLSALMAASREQGFRPLSSRGVCRNWNCGHCMVNVEQATKAELFHNLQVLL